METNPWCLDKLSRQRTFLRIFQAKAGEFRLESSGFEWPAPGERVTVPETSQRGVSVAKRETSKEKGQVLPISEAARVAGVGRSTIYRYLEKGILSPVGNKDGYRGISLSELARVFPQVSPETPQEHLRGPSAAQVGRGRQIPPGGRPGRHHAG